MKNEVLHTAHSSYRCEYHIVFAPKYRRKIIYKSLKRDIGEILRKLCNEMKVEIIEYVGEYPSVHECSTVRRKTQEQECTDDF